MRNKDAILVNLLGCLVHRGAHSLSQLNRLQLGF
jgi:hypothetical protein